MYVGNGDGTSSGPVRSDDDRGGISGRRANRGFGPSPMRIDAIRSYALQSALEQPFAFSQGWVTKRSATLVEVITDEGISGWGEAFNQGLEPPQISSAVIEHALKPLVLGANPLDVEVLWHAMYQATRDYGRKGSVMAAISAIDIALWDIAGKTYGVPIYQLLGGAFRPRVQAYATGFYRIKGRGEAERLAEEALGHVAAGFSAFKIKLGFGLSDDMAVMHAMGWPMRYAWGGCWNRSSFDGTRSRWPPRITTATASCGRR